MMDWFNDDLSDYINKKEKVLIDVRQLMHENFIFV